MTEWEKGQLGYLYDANFDKEVLLMRNQCAELCRQFNLISPLDGEAQAVLIKKIVHSIGRGFTVTAPFFCDFGINITIGDNFYSNHNCSILDGGRVTIGDSVFIAPNCVISTAGHPIDAGQRDAGLEIALPITIGSHVWIGANCSILPGVTIGDDVVIGAGSVVNRNIPSHVVAAGNPCRVIRSITAADKDKYPIYKK